MTSPSSKSAAAWNSPNPASTVQFAAYYFPNFHPDPRHDAVHGPNWTEWELLKQATPRFPGHRQPRLPLWGYENEADPATMRKKIACAWQHGLDAFIFDWYFYADGLFLQRALEQGFMPVADGSTLRFALMWANHNWNDIHPWAAGTPIRTLYPGRLDDASFERLCDLLVDRYFPHPAYWRLDGKCYFSIYNLPFLGDLQRLRRLRERAESAGFPLHLNLIIPGNPILPGELGMTSFTDVLQAGYADSATLYVWNSHVRMDTFPLYPYAQARRRIADVNRAYADTLPVPFFPNVTAGWDCSPRTRQDTPYLNHGYPYCPVMTATPEEFGQAVADAVSLKPTVVTINAWNEWTEGSYLEPDREYGLGFLEQLHQQSGRRQRTETPRFPR